MLEGYRVGEGVAAVMGEDGASLGDPLIVETAGPTARPENDGLGRTLAALAGVTRVVFILEQRCAPQAGFSSSAALSYSRAESREVDSSFLIQLICDVPIPIPTKAARCNFFRAILRHRHEPV